MKWSNKQKLRHYAFRLAVAPLALTSRNGYFTRVGWYRSVARKEPVGADGAPIPWWSYPALEFIGGRLQPTMRVLEFGSGYSTMWLAGRVQQVVSLEADREWLEMLRTRVPGNVELIGASRDKSGAEQALVPEQEYDVMVVDGLNRVGAAKSSLRWLAPGGIIIYDDYDLETRPWHAEAGQFLHEHGFRDIVFAGPAPMADGYHCTALFYRPDNCFRI